jgi:CheY-like chemotaxis protein
LRTPLNAVMGYAQVLERDPALAAARLNSVKVIRRSAEHLSGLIDGLLDISKIEAGRLQLARNQIRFGEFLAQVVDMLRFQAEAKGLAFTFHRPARLPDMVIVDEKRLRQVLVNLISNAIKFTESGAVTLDVTLRNQVATFAVADTGSGIAAADLERIFEPFERGADVGAQPGLGLGLTITKMLVTLMGGDIQVTSTPGVGSLFAVRLMLTEVMRPAERVTLPEIRGYRGARRSIMVVDDNAEHRDLIREILAPLGFKLYMAENGAMCLEMSEALQPDLFLLDISMPGMNGWQLARALRDRGYRDARVIILSANIGESSPPSGEQEAHDEAIAKPFDVDRLLDRLRHYLGIEWIRGDEPAEITEVQLLADAVAVARLVRPAADVAAETGGHRLHAAIAAQILQFARIGYVRGIEKSLETLDEATLSGPILARIRAALATFDMPGLIALVEAMETDE